MFYNRAITRSLTGIQGLNFSSRSLTSKPSKDFQVKVANNYNKRRAAYKRAVGKLRKQYADEVAQQRRTDEKAQKEKEAEDTRKRLERQRLKNIQSVKNALRHEEARKKRAEEFEEELRIAQINREARMERFDKARRLVVQELEEEAVHWLSTPEEVDAAFDIKGNAQKLWTRPGGFIGAPLPADDADFWRYESHTWDMSRTYRTPRDKFMEELEELAYDESNFDASYWDDDKIEFQREMEQRAKLRALVREEGRKSLLLKQRQMMQDNYAEKNTVGPDGMPRVPSAMPAPSLHVLADYEAMEKEGAKILEEDPSKFFVFDSEGEEGEDSAQGLGKPVRLRDPVRDSSPSGTPYPELLGRVPKGDTRTHKEKKRQEREERMWAAAQAEDVEGVEFTGDDEIAPSSKPVDYDQLGNFGDEDDIAWEEGLDPRSDAELLEIPTEGRFSEEDIDWLIESIEKKIAGLEEIMKLEKASDTSAAIPDERYTVEKALGVNTRKSKKIDERGREYTSYEVLGENENGSVLATLSEAQISAIAALDDDESTTPEEVRNALSKVPGLTEEQIQSLVDLEMTLIQANDLLKSSKDDKKD